MRHRLAAACWVLEEDGRSDALGVFVNSRYRRLGRGRRPPLITFSLEERERDPVWSLSGTNTASRALAEALGFGGAEEEMLFRI